MALKALAASAFVLMAAAMTVRPILGEMWTTEITQLISPSPLWWNTSPAVMYIAHLAAAAGMLLGVLWLALKRRTWQFTGLEPAILLMVLAALFSVPGASDKRLAINVAIGTILPIGVAAVLVQMLGSRDAWRRALLAAIIAAAVANCCRATRQQIWEYEETWQHYLETKAEYWAKQGKSLDDPTVEIFESRIKAHQPSGYFYHPNVMASFLLLGIAAAAVASGAGHLPWRRPRGNEPGRRAPAEPRAATRGARAANRSSPADQPIPWPTICLVAMAGIILWQLIVIYWVGSVGAKAGIAAGIVAGLGVWLLRKRPWTAALLCLAMLAGLQLGLTGLAIGADSVVPGLTERGGKLRSLAFRLDYWHGAIDLFTQHPITGVGPGQFGQAYPSVKPIRAAEEVSHCHNWLLNVAAEWGVVGLIGTIAALVLPAWVLLRRRGQAHAPPRSTEAPQSSTPAMLLAWVTVSICWLIYLPGVVPAGSAVFVVETLPALPMALACAALATIPAASVAAPFLLLAGLVGFFVHSSAEMGPGVPAAAWPFWAMVALALAYCRRQDSTDDQAPSAGQTIKDGGSGRQPARGTQATGPGASSLRSTPLLRPALLLTAAGCLVVLVLTVSPLRAIWSMSLAKNAFETSRGYLAGEPLHDAAAADPLDPAPRAALSEFYRRMAAANPEQAANYLTRARAYAREAVRANPGSHTLRHDLAWTLAQYAVATGDATAAQEAVAAMRSAVDLYPNWPRGYLQLGMLLAGAGERVSDGQDLLRDAVSAFDTALSLNERWPAEDPNKFDASELAELHARRQQLLNRLKSPATSQPTSSVLP